MEGIEGKKVTVFYNDFEKVSRKDGVLTEITKEGSYVLDGTIIIPSHRIVRVEVRE